MKTKTILFFLFTTCLVYTTYGQNHLNISQSDNSRLIKVLNNSNLIAENRDNWIAVRVYKTDNGSDNSELPEGHEVSQNLLIAVSEFNENPSQNVFEIGPFLNPKFLTWSELNKYEKEFEVEYGVFDQRKKLKLAININKLKINE